MVDNQSSDVDYYRPRRLVIKLFTPSWLMRTGGCTAIAMGVACSAVAQSAASQHPYVSVSAIADVKRFSGDPATNVLDGQTAGIAAAFGSSLGARWDLEVGVDAPRDSTNSRPRVVTVRREVITLQSRTRNRALSFDALIRFRARQRGRLQMGYLGGLSFLRLQRQFDTVAPADTPEALVPRPTELLSYGAAPTIGVDAHLALTDHLLVVPAIRVSAFNFDGVSGVLLRPRIGVGWVF